MEANDCPTRLRTAETAKFYTTLAEITAKEFEGRENAAIARLGDPFVELLFDLFILPEGPRLRDKVILGIESGAISSIMYFNDFFQVGHGETDFENDEVHEKWCHVVGMGLF